MTTAQREAHLRLMQILPVRTHMQFIPPAETNKYTGKPVPSESHQRALAKRVLPSGVNTWIEKSPKVER